MEVRLTFVQGDVAVSLNLYPSHYQMAFAFSILLYPQPYWLTLRLAFPEREGYGLTTFR